MSRPNWDRKVAQVTYQNHGPLVGWTLVGGSCTGPFLPMRVKFGVLKQTERITLQAKFRLNVFIVSASGCRKPQFWANSAQTF